MSKFVLINIKTMGPIKTDLSYISGSAIRGSYIQHYINKNNIKEDISLNEQYRGKLLTNIRFFDAYPKVDGIYSIPTPLCFYAHKNDIKKFSRDKVAIDIRNEFVDEIDEGFQRVNKSEFSIINKNSLDLISVKKVENLHNCKQKNTENIFRYEAIDKSQEFYSIIQCDETLAKEVKETLDKQTIYIGGSKSSGYGRCEVEVEGIFDYKDIKNKYNIGLENKSNTLNVFFQSDAIIKDSLGNIKPYIEPEFLKEKLDLDEVKLIKSSIISKDVKGYNAMWKCKVPNVTAIKAGSVITYSYKGNLDSELIEKLEIEGVGSRKTDGFGRIFINPKFNVQKCDVYKSTEEVAKKVVQLDKESSKFIGNMFKSISKVREEEYLTKVVVEALNKNITDSYRTKKVVLDKFRPSQMGRFIDLMDIALNEADDKKSKDIIVKFKQELKTNTKDLYNKRSEHRLFDLSLMEYLDEIVLDKTIGEITGTGFKLEYPNLKGVSYDKTSNYRLKLKLSKKIFEYKIRENNEGGNK